MACLLNKRDVPASFDGPAERQHTSVVHTSRPIKRLISGQRRVTSYTRACLFSLPLAARLSVPFLPTRFAVPAPPFLSVVRRTIVRTLRRILVPRLSHVLRHRTLRRDLARVHIYAYIYKYYIRARAASYSHRLYSRRLLRAILRSVGRSVKLARETEKRDGERDGRRSERAKTAAGGAVRSRSRPEAPSWPLYPTS